MHGAYDVQVKWETDGLNRSDVIVFWVPRNMANMPGLTTNDEWGYWKARVHVSARVWRCTLLTHAWVTQSSGKVVWGSPPEAASVKYQRSYCTAHGITQCDTLLDTLRAALQLIGTGALR